MHKLPTHLRFCCNPVLAVLVSLFLLLLYSTTAGAEVGVEVTQVGWDGTVVPRSWSPVRVRATGNNTDANARVEIVMMGRQQNGPQAAVVEYAIGAYGQEVALPAGVTKEVTIWVPAEDATPGVGMAGLVRLSVGEKVLAEQRVEFRTSKTPFWPLMGVLADSPAPARAISQVELPYQGLPIPLTVARLTAADIPTLAERLEALSALVVQGNAATLLTGEQRRAVQDWVVAGGHLVLAGGPEASRVATVLPPNALPVTFANTDNSVDLEPLAQWAGVPGKASLSGPATSIHASAGAALAGPPGRPLAWRLGMGQGTITLLAVDPGLEPLASWTGAPAVLRKALEPALPEPNDNEKMAYLRAQQTDVPSQLQGAVEALPPEVFPEWQTVALILGIFALVVGPLLHLLLWRIDRREWMWLSVPPAALLVAVSLFYFGIGRGGRDVITHVVAHVQLDPEGGVAHQWLLAGFFAPTHSKLAIDVPGDNPVKVLNRGTSPYNSVGAPMSPAAETPFHVIGGRDTRVEFDSGQWDMRTVALSRGLGQEVGSITARLGLEGDILKGTIRNDTPYPLEDAAVLVGQSLAKLGNLAPGQTAQVVLDPGPTASIFRGGYPPSLRLFGRPIAAGAGGATTMYAARPAVISAVSSSGYMGGVSMPTEQLELPQDPETQRRVRLMDSIVSAPMRGPGSETVPLTFLAFTRAVVGKEMPTAGDHPTYHLTLLEQPLHLELPPGPFTVPPSLVPFNMSTTSGYGSGGNGVISWMQLMGGSATFTFHPPVPARAKAEALLLTTLQVGPTAPLGAAGKPSAPPSPTISPTAAEAGIFSVYNWQSAAWEPLPGGQERARLEPAAPYVGPDGAVKLQVAAGPDRSVQFVQPELAVEGRVAE